jgi:hypothetical protein
MNFRKDYEPSRRNKGRILDHGWIAFPNLPRSLRADAWSRISWTG